MPLGMKHRESSLRAEKIGDQLVFVERATI
jgi:hypothetical protein